ncbi:hypothetical protein PAHAL_3G176100 [Panicum hallii]|jgi:hypothetical protein|uniref:DUF1645 domain-containing protein n=1 Tax=Panicum hallii TaxID=206008 RepID=A0A2S3H9H0_9POAL|nr:uncharacterized protein LOC112886219 [Panicum hallii]PAN18074.1 hypothetical protein PAHAL_3G176100 [Panicum hallii]
MDDGDFTFAAVPPPLLAAGGGGRMGVLYPVFGRPRSPPRPPAPELETATARVPLGRLLLVDREPAPAQQPPAPADDLDSVPAEMYCPWSPGWSAASPARCKKSGSTGSVLRWRPRLVGRSQSDGKEKFVFLNTTGAASGRSGRKGRSGGGGVSAALGGHAWSYYASGGASNGARRRSFLPYKQDLVGLFANAAVFRRSYLPF